MIVDACGLTLVFFKIINSNTNLNLNVPLNVDIFWPKIHFSENIFGC